MNKLLGLVLGSFLLVSPVFAQTDAIDLSRAVFEGGSPNISSRPVTTSISQVVVAPNGVLPSFGKMDGPVRWPDVVPPGWDGPIQYTLWYGMRINGEWHVCAATEYWFRRGLDGDNAGGNITGPATSDDPNLPPGSMQLPAHILYFCGAMKRMPAIGEQVAIFVSAGDQRRMDVWSVQERSNVVLISFPVAAPTVFTFNSQPEPTPAPAPQPTPTPNPVPSPTPLPPVVDLSQLQTQLDALAKSVQEDLAVDKMTQEELHVFHEEVKKTWQDYTKFIGKYIAPALSAFIAGKFGFN